MEVLHRHVLWRAFLILEFGSRNNQVLLNKGERRQCISRRRDYTRSNTSSLVKPTEISTSYEENGDRNRQNSVATAADVQSGVSTVSFADAKLPQKWQLNPAQLGLS